jgi:hypothetical protein
VLAKKKKTKEKRIGATERRYIQKGKEQSHNKKERQHLMKCAHKAAIGHTPSFVLSIVLPPFFVYRAITR